MTTSEKTISSILKDLTNVHENLLSLSDDIWNSIDHNDSEKLEEGYQSKDEKKIITAVNEILAIKEKDPDADISEKENALNQMVYALYGLDDNDVKIIESANRI